jgi:hypothetical protein
MTMVTATVMVMTMVTEMTMVTATMTVVARHLLVQILRVLVRRHRLL